MTVEEAIRTKRAVRRFEPRDVSDEDVRHILDAGRRAQSAMNKQPWHFIAVRDPDRLEQLATGWATHLATASLGVFLLVEPSAWSSFDGGQAAAYMQLAGWDRGLASGIGTYPDPEPARRLLGWPDHLQLLVVLAFGAAPPPASHRVNRRPLEDIAHHEHW